MLYRTSTRAPRASLQPSGFSWAHVVPGLVPCAQPLPRFEIIVSPALREKAGRAVDPLMVIRDTLWMDGEEEENSGLNNVGERWLWRRVESEIRVDTGDMDPRPEHWNDMTRNEQLRWHKNAYKNQPHMLIKVVTDYGSTRVEQRDDGWTRQIVLYEKGTLSPYDFHHVNTEPFRFYV